MRRMKFLDRTISLRDDLGDGIAEALPEGTPDEVILKAAEAVMDIVSDHVDYALDQLKIKEDIEG